MLSEKAKEVLGKLELDYAPVALKFSPTKPVNDPQSEKKCLYVSL